MKAHPGADALLQQGIIVTEHQMTGVAAGAVQMLGTAESMMTGGAGAAQMGVGQIEMTTGAADAVSRMEEGNCPLRRLSWETKIGKS